MVRQLSGQTFKPKEKHCDAITPYTKYLPVRAAPGFTRSFFALLFTQDATTHR